MAQMTGENFVISMDYCDYGDKIALGVTLLGHGKQLPTRVATHVPCDATHSELAGALEALAQRIRGR